VPEGCTRGIPLTGSDRASVATIRTCWASLLIVLLLAVQCFAVGLPVAGEGEKMGTLKGAVLTQDAASRSYVSRAKVQASGPVTVQTETDSKGRFEFEGLPAGTYTLTASAPGLETQQTVTLQPSQVLEVAIELRPSVVMTSVKVSASDSTAATSPAPTQAISEKTVRDAPNINERMESLLPLVPGVVRGLTGGST
jgi:Carboxypeptidase regulatory-like domain